MICTIRDSLIESWHEGQPRWQVTLNNGVTVFQDDGRSGLEPANAWLRLKEYCYKHELYIINMMIGFRDNTYQMPAEMDGYYFCRGSRGMFGLIKTLQLFFVGYIPQNKSELIVECWKVPEMIKDKVETRTIQESLACLINKDSHQFTAQ